MQTLAQKRSEYVLGKLTVEEKSRKEFTTLVQGLPAMILQNGLGHSLAFLLAKAEQKDKDRHRIAFDILAGWLQEQKIVSDSSPNAVMKSVSTMEQGKYLTGQTEALKVLEWVKRYAKAGLFAERG